MTSLPFSSNYPSSIKDILASIFFSFFYVASGIFVIARAIFRAIF